MSYNLTPAEVETKYTVSVALATYNGARFLSQQVLSILAQSHPVDEIVVSDDNSTDATVSIVELLVAEHNAVNARPPISLVVLHNKPGLGVTHNFERAVSGCSGDILFLSDQDDVWHPDKVKKMLAVFGSHPSAQLVFTNARTVDGVGTPLGYSLFEAIELQQSELYGVREGKSFEVLLRRNIVTGATVAFRRKLLDDALPFPRGWVHDEWLAIIASVTSSIEVMTEELIDYRQHGANEIGALKQGVGEKLKKLFYPRRERNQSLYDRAMALPPRLQAMKGIPPSFCAAAEDKLTHEDFRRGLPGGRLFRIGPVFRELQSGRYDRYGYGRKDAVRDILQPDR
ncbi:glycosyltransferase family 2 protein [Lysinibacter sp. HNR]|uniref:glycosyltransferase family 2 protein n=1 Tax=Lysinibacter sp. HNR TaxID=3031408 RepID=UPI002434E4A7|nr:glycosyltransferase family 2 protein [Lysinibacter sp. HNR]WGD38090.1 glycosyltransferase family 2 protein [Lysinibacter sp. HNR]